MGEGATGNPLVTWMSISKIHLFEKMTQRTSPSTIDLDAVASIERHLDQTEIYSLIFLLYKNVDAATQDILLEIQSFRKYRPVLDSALFRAAENSHFGGPVARWARSREDHWQDKLLEALLIIKNYSIIKMLRKSRNELELKFLPLQIDTSCYVDRVRKVLFLMMEGLSVEEWDQLQRVLVDKAGQQIPSPCRSVPECLLLYLMSKNLLKTRQGGEKMDFQLLRNSLKVLDLFDWSDKLCDLENSINEENNNQTYSVMDVNNAIPAFNLDPGNPGTVLIVNLEQYDEEGMGSKPLPRRTGTHLDCEKLEDTFNLLGFKIKCLPNPTSEEIRRNLKTSLRAFCEEYKDTKKERCFVVVILAHGSRDGVFGRDGKMVTWDSIRTELRSSDTLNLPRLLVVQACKGESRVTKNSEKLVVEEDGPSYGANAGNLRDLFELSATVPGFVAYRSKEYGSFFINSFCKHILLCGRESNLSLIAVLINEDLKNLTLIHKEQPAFMTSDFSSTSSKMLFLRVPENKDIEAKALVKKWENNVISASKRDTVEAPHDRKCQENIRANQPQNLELYQEMKALALQLGNGRE